MGYRRSWSLLCRHGTVLACRGPLAQWTSQYGECCSPTEGNTNPGTVTILWRENCDWLHCGNTLFKTDRYNALYKHLYHSIVEYTFLITFTGHSRVCIMFLFIQWVGLILDTDWLKPHSRRCLFPKLPPAKDVEMTVYSVLISLRNPLSHQPSQAIYKLDLRYKKHLDIISHFHSGDLYKPCCLSLWNLQHCFNIEILSPAVS